MSANEAVADRFEEFAARLEATGVEYKPQSYRRAAENVRTAPQSVEALADEGPEALTEIEGVGEALAAKVIEYVETGEIEELAELRAELPVEMDALTSVGGVGPKTVGTLYAKLGIEDLDDLEAAAHEERIRELDGFGAKTEENILAGIDFARTAHERTLLGAARPVGEALCEHVADAPGVERCALAGSLRRWRETIGDVDVLAASHDPEPVIERFTDWERADTVIEAGTTKASVRAEGVRADLRVVVPGEFGSALQYFTGSRDHNIGFRNRAIQRDLKVNEYGVFDVSGVEDPEEGEGTEGSRTSSDNGPDGSQRVGERVAGETEAGMYDAIGLPPIAPELREDNGELDAAATGDLPDLVSIEDIRGDLHSHTQHSDGESTIREMIQAATALGHDYLAVTDHATGPGMVGGVGLTDEELLAQADEIDAAMERAVAETDADIEVFHGVEANIDAEGGISVGEDALAELDLVVASPHSGLDGDGTQRLIAAIEHPEVDIVGHPTGRYLDRRPGLDIDVEAVASAAADHDTALEVNANPARLDLGGGAVRIAIEAGATISIDTDAHQPAGFEVLRYGVHTARRGWAEPEDVLNARSAADFLEFLS